MILTFSFFFAYQKKGMILYFKFFFFLVEVGVSGVRECTLHIIVIRFGRRIYDIVCFVLILFYTFLYSPYILINMDHLHYKFIKKNKSIM
jgi:hypothetical protein